IGVLDVTVDRVHDDRLRQRQLLLTLDIQVEHRIGAVLAQDGGERQRIQRQMLRIGLVPVQDRRNVARAAGAARGTLAELGADLRFEKVDVGHDWITPTALPGLWAVAREIAPLVRWSARQAKTERKRPEAAPRRSRCRRFANPRRDNPNTVTQRP